LILLGADAVAMSAAFLGAFALRFPFNHWWGELPHTARYLPLVVVFGWAVYIVTGMYRTLWRYASVKAALIVIYSSFLAVAVPAGILMVWGPYTSYWSVFVIQWLLLVSIVGSGRFSIRVFRDLTSNRSRRAKKRVLIFGAGDAGEMIARDLLRSSWHNLQLVGFIDDDPHKRHHSIHNVPILGGLKDIPSLVERKKIDEIVVAMPSLTGSQMRRIRTALLQELNGQIALKTVPGIAELINGRVSLEQVRRFNVRDLLRRSPVVLEIERVRKLINGKCVLVSGAGGSIGSEICRQAATFAPSELVLVDISEPSLYEIMEELAEKFPHLNLIPVVGDAACEPLIKRVFSEHLPKIVFHAAAYKHVPLMEENPWSAVYNNVMGTRVLAKEAAEHHVERFVLISTDKAVRPSSVMGASKRICEMVVQAQPRDDDCVFCAVRFGNVMGSSGSVIPKFERQIKAGGPVTVTHPEVTRFFMLTSEAVQLVMQAATLDRDKAIYILDMGDPVKIDDIAHEMIEMTNHDRDRPIEIKYIGLRPGEKLHEELYHSGNGNPTEIEKIWITDSPPPQGKAFLKAVDKILANCNHLSGEKLIYELKRLVPDYKSTNTVFLSGEMKGETGRLESGVFPK